MPHSSAAAVSGQESFRPNNIAVAGISKGMPLKINMKYYNYLNLKKMFHIFKILFFRQFIFKYSVIYGGQFFPGEGPKSGQIFFSFHFTLFFSVHHFVFVSYLLSTGLQKIGRRIYE